MGKLQFDQLCHEVGLQSEQDIDVVKRYLVFTKQLYQKTDHDVWACKFGAEVEESDFGVLKIKRTVKVLQGIISDLDAEILKSKAEAKMLVALGLSTRALHHLRIAKKFDLVLQQRLSSLDILDNLLSKINQSRTELDILSAYEVGTKTLKEILKKDELQLDNIQDTMDALTDVLEDQEEISNAMASVEEFDEDLENELDALIQSATATPLKGQSSSDIISQPGTPQRVPATETAALSRENSKIGLKRPALAGGSGPPSRNSSDGIENKLEQLKVSTPKLKKKVAEMIPAE